MATDLNVTTNPPMAWRRFTRLSLGLSLIGIAVIGVGLGIYREYGEVVTSTYPIADLLPEDPTSSDPSRNTIPLSAVNLKVRLQIISDLKSTVQPSSWDDHGGRGTITPFFLNDSLIIKNSRAVHRKTDAWLDRKRKEKQASP